MSRREEILSAARRLLDTEGLEAITMRRLADELGIQAPSLYKHVAGRDEILTDLQADAVAEFGALLAAVVGDDVPDVAAMARAYRAWAHAQPARYALMMRHLLDRDRLPAGLEATAEPPVLHAAGGDRARARVLWGVAHGLVDLELAGWFPPGADLDAAWAAAVAAFTSTPVG